MPDAGPVGAFATPMVYSHPVAGLFREWELPVRTVERHDGYRVVVAQNLYDDPSFFENYSRLPRSIHGLAGAPEWPAIKAALPRLAGLRVVDLGCGYGWFCRWAAEVGAQTVLGIDVSQRMLDRALSEPNDARVRYRRADLEELVLPPASFDLAYSSLTLHYLEHLDHLMSTVRSSLVRGGRFVFTVEHPLYTAPSHPSWRSEGDQVVWPLDHYLDEGPRITDWMGPGVVKQHRTIGTYVHLLLDHGFEVRHLEEWGPSAEEVQAVPEWAVERHRPPFLIVGARAV